MRPYAPIVRKIPTVFVRDPDDRKRLTREIEAGCEWVIDGEGIATRKYDGTCMMLDDAGSWWARREVKRGRTAPLGFRALGTDPRTGKTVGWEPADQSPFHRYLLDAIDVSGTYGAGTYELCGPRVNKDPESFGHHVLVSHWAAERVRGLDGPRTYDLVESVLGAPDFRWEGVVFHHPDGRMAKVKRKDFRR